MTYIRPDLQIIEIKKNITAYFWYVYKDETIISDLFSINSKKQLEYDGKDEPSPTSIDIINNPKSTAKTALAEKKIITIPDTSKKGVNFVIDKSYDIKSILCYPIFEKSKVKYIISVSSLNKNVFTKENEERNKFALDKFAEQIKLAAYLKPILELSYD